MLQAKAREGEARETHEPRRVATRRERPFVPILLIVRDLKIINGIDGHYEAAVARGAEARADVGDALDAAHRRKDARDELEHRRSRDRARAHAARAVVEVVGEQDAGVARIKAAGQVGGP